MFSIFNGTRRVLGDAPGREIELKIHVDFRQYLKHFKGAKLAVFLAIALHMDKGGWASPTISALHAETGYDDGTITPAITDLCKMTINGQRVMLAVQQRDKGRFVRNRYLVLPTEAEIERHEAQPEARKPRQPRPEKQVTVKPRPVLPYTENPAHSINSQSLDEYPVIDSEREVQDPDKGNGPETPLTPTLSQTALSNVEPKLIGDGSGPEAGSSTTIPGTIAIKGIGPEPSPGCAAPGPSPIRRGTGGEVKSRRKTNTPDNPVVWLGGGRYIGPFPSMAAAQRYASGQGTITDLSAVQPPAAIEPAPIEPKRPPKPKSLNPVAVQILDSFFVGFGKEHLPPGGIAYGPLIRFATTLAREETPVEQMNCAGELYRAWWQAVGSPVLDWGAGEVITAIRLALGLCRKDVTGERITQHVRVLRADPFWRDKFISFSKVVKEVTGNGHSGAVLDAIDQERRTPDYKWGYK